MLYYGFSFSNDNTETEQLYIQQKSVNFWSRFDRSSATFNINLGSDSRTFPRENKRREKKREYVKEKECSIAGY